MLSWAKATNSGYNYQNKAVRAASRALYIATHESSLTVSRSFVVLLAESVRDRSAPRAPRRAHVGDLAHALAQHERLERRRQGQARAQRRAHVWRRRTPGDCVQVCRRVPSRSGTQRWRSAHAPSTSRRSCAMRGVLPIELGVSRMCFCVCVTTGAADLLAPASLWLPLGARRTTVRPSHPPLPETL